MITEAESTNGNSFQNEAPNNGDDGHVGDDQPADKKVSTLPKPELMRLVECYEALSSDQTPQPVRDWFELISKEAKWTRADFKPFLSWSVTLIVVLFVLAVSGVGSWFVTHSWVATMFITLGLGLGVAGIAQQIAELAAIGGIFAKTMAWYLAPSISTLSMLQRYGISIGLAALFEYPFLTFANAIALRLKLALRLRAIQDTTDVCASFVMIAVSGEGSVNVFSIVQMVLALLRVAIAVIGGIYFEKNVDHRARVSKASGVHRALYVEKINVLLKQVSERIQIPEAVFIWSDLLSSKDTASLPDGKGSIMNKVYSIAFNRHAMICGLYTVCGITLGTVGVTILTDPYSPGVAAVLGMGLAWYLGPNLGNCHPIMQWLISIGLCATLEYPFLTVANTRAAEIGETFELRAIQDLASLITGAVLIVVLSDARLTKVDAAQLFVGFLRVVVASRFFWSVGSR